MKSCYDKNARSEAEMSGSKRDEYDEQVRVSASPDNVLSSFSCNACSSNFLSESFLSSSSIFLSSSVGSSTVHELQRRNRVSIKTPKKLFRLNRWLLWWWWRWCPDLHCDGRHSAGIPSASPGVAVCCSAAVGAALACAALTRSCPTPAASTSQPWQKPNRANGRTWQLNNSRTNK